MPGCLIATRVEMHVADFRRPWFTPLYAGSRYDLPVFRSQPAVFVVSIDLEMSWGAIHHGQPQENRLYAKERQMVRAVLDLMEEYHIGATWAIVGHLFLASCAPVEGRNHPEIVRPDYQWHSGDWYDQDPCSDVEREPTWYAPDLLKAIRESSSSQEIGSHSFGHIIVGDPGCDREAFRSDVAACVSTAAENGIELRSFVFPRNSIGHVDVLEEAGFTAYRGHPPDRFRHTSDWRKRILGLIDRVSPRQSSAVWPSRTDGLVDVPQTYFFDPSSVVANRFGAKMWSWLARRRLRHAVRTGSLFHVWFHTHNLATNPDRALRGLEDLFREARHHIDEGRLENLTMGALADRWSDSDLG